MLNEKMEQALNGQINAELHSAYLYLSMSAYFQSANMPGFGWWMRLQAQEEMDHAMKFFDFIILRGGRVSLKAVDRPPAEWESPLVAFQAAYEHEEKVTAMIARLAELADQQNDLAAAGLLQWFVDEQVEEEANARAVVQKLKMAGGSAGGLMILDKELGQRKPGKEGD